MPWWKLPFCSRSSSARSSSRGSRSFAARKRVSASTKRSSGSGGRLSSQSGSFLVLLLALVALGSIFFGASLRLILSSQKLIATKARLDICAVRLATSRERFLRNVTATNDYVYTSLITTYIARGLMFVPVVGPAAAIGQRGSAVANKSFARGQEAMILKQQGEEALLMKCEKTPFSEQAIFCSLSQPILKTAMKRGKALFPDLYQRYEWKKKDLGTVSCYLAANPTLRTKLRLKGDPQLKIDNYTDAYAN
jgi:hypothetical protein